MAASSSTDPPPTPQAKPKPKSPYQTWVPKSGVSAQVPDIAQHDFPTFGQRVYIDEDNSRVWEHQLARRPEWLNQKEASASGRVDTELYAARSSWPTRGMPVAPPEAIGDPEKSRWFSYRNSTGPAGGATICNFAPERYVTTVCGRPCGLLVMSHDFATPDEYDQSTLATRFAPLRPLTTLGPTGKTRDSKTYKGDAHIAVWDQCT